MMFKKNRKQSGQALVEFTLMFPIFLAVVLGLATFSILFYSYVTMQLAVREAASAAVHNPKQSVDAIRTVACDSSFSLIKSSLLVQVEPPDTTAVSCSNPNTGTSAPATWVPGGSIAVKLSYSVPMPSATISLPGGALVRFGPIPITAQSRMTIE
jgi:Flp pilus assembly protein TadG